MAQTSRSRQFNIKIKTLEWKLCNKKYTLAHLNTITSSYNNKTQSNICLIRIPPPPPNNTVYYDININFSSIMPLKFVTIKTCRIDMCSNNKIYYIDVK